MSIKNARLWQSHAEAAQAKLERYSRSPRHNAGRIKAAKKELAFARQRATQELLKGTKKGDVNYLDWSDMTEQEQRKVSDRLSKRRNTMSRFIYETEETKDGKTVKSRTGTGYEEYRGSDTLYAESKKDRRYKPKEGGEITQKASDLKYLAIVRFKEPKVKE